MLRIIEGKVGAGKTLYTVRRMVERIAQGRFVATNVEFKRPELYEYIRRNHGVYMRPDQLVELPECEEIVEWHNVIPAGSKEAPLLVVIDETQLQYNARNWQNTRDTQAEMLDFLTQTRKVFLDIDFITQDNSTIDKQFRVQAERIVFCRNMSDVNVPVLGLPLFNSIWYTERCAKKSEMIYSRDKWRIQPELFSVYNSFALYSTKMKEWLEGREVVGKINLRRVNPLRRFISKAENWGGLDAQIAEKLRPFVAWYLWRTRPRATAPATE